MVKYKNKLHYRILRIQVMNIIKPCLAQHSSTMVLIVLVTCHYSCYAHVSILLDHLLFLAAQLPFIVTVLMICWNGQICRPGPK